MSTELLNSTRSKGVTCCKCYTEVMLKKPISNLCRFGSI
jgi:hypothetical protein